MFVMKTRWTYRWPVTVHVPTDGGEHVEQTFTGHFLVLPIDQVAATDEQFLRDSLIGWSDVGDDAGKPLAFSDQARDMLIGLPFVREALRRAVLDAMRGDRWAKAQA